MSSTRDLPALTFAAAALERPVPYTASMYASLDGSAFTVVGAIQSGKGHGGRIDRILSELAARPGFHAVRVRADFEFAGASTASRTLPTLFYAFPTTSSPHQGS